jgi:hypothetical protein
MTTLNKCVSENCLHDFNLPITQRWELDNNKVIAKIHKKKWHQCLVCNRWQVSNWIERHEFHCKNFAEMRKNCVQKGHTHSTGIACNM